LLGHDNPGAGSAEKFYEIRFWRVYHEKNNSISLLNRKDKIFKCSSFLDEIGYFVYKNVSPENQFIQKTNRTEGV